MAIIKRNCKNIFLIMAILILGLLFYSKTTVIHAFTTNPTPTSQYVTDDYDDLLTNKTKQMVVQQEKYYKYHTATKPQIVVMTIPNSHGESIDDYADDLLENPRWHFGSKKYNNGVLILFAKNHGKNNVRISTGYGVEGILPDLKCNHFLEKNKKLLKSHNDSKINKGLQNVFDEVTSTLGHRYTHLDRKQANKVLAKQQHKKYAKNIFYIIIAIIALGLLVPPYNGNWFCGSLLLLNFLGSDDDDDNDDDFFGGSGGFTDSGSGGSFGGGGSSI